MDGGCSCYGLRPLRLCVQTVSGGESPLLSTGGGGAHVLDNSLEWWIKAQYNGREIYTLKRDYRSD